VHLKGLKLYFWGDEFQYSYIIGEIIPQLGGTQVQVANATLKV
jgi:hypothetical protein